MKFSKSQLLDKGRAVIVLQRNQIVIYQDSKAGLSSLPLEQLVRDLEVIDEAQFADVVSKSFKQLDILAGTQVVLLLDPTVSFTQQVSSEADQGQPQGDSTEDGVRSETLAPSQQAHAEALRLSFTKAVPFANTYSTVIEIGKEKLIVAVNRELYEPIVRALEALRCKLTHILPIVGLPVVFSGGVTEESIKELLRTIDRYKQLNLLETSVSREPEPIMSTTMKSKEHPRRVYTLIGLFVLLLLLFGAVWYWSYQRDQAEKLAIEQKQTAAEQAAQVQQIEVLTTPSPVATPITSLSDIRMQIEYASGSANLVTSMTADFTELGISELASSVTTQVTPSRTVLVQVSQNVSETIRQQVLDALNAYELNVIVDEVDISQELGVDILLRV